MKRAFRFLGVAALLSAFAASSTAEMLAPGSKAPELSVVRWFKGKPVTKLDPNKMYVVEFWATWCGPCKTSIPHLTKLAKENKDVTFIGVSIWEDDKDEVISKFVKEMGDKMDYVVGYSGNKEGMSQTWMEAAGQNGIPSSFIVKGGKVMWIGHPMSMDEPLKKIKAGNWDVEAERVKFVKEAEVEKKRMDAYKGIAAAEKMYAEGKKAEAVAKLDEIEKNIPDMKEMVLGSRTYFLAFDDPEACAKALDEMMKGGEQGKGRLIDFGMKAAREPKAAASAKYAAELLVRASEKDFLGTYYATMMYEQLKEYKLGLDAANAALKLLPESPYKENAALKKSLEAKRDEFAKKVAGTN